MHVLDRPHLPRLTIVSIAAALTAIVISLAVAAGITHITQPGSSPTITARQPPAIASVDRAITPRWAAVPFASLLSQPLPQPWRTAQR